MSNLCLQDHATGHISTRNYPSIKLAICGGLYSVLQMGDSTKAYDLSLCQFICRQHQFAIRATLLSTETLKSRNIYLDAAMQFMRMTAEVMFKLLYQVLPDVMIDHFKNNISKVEKRKTKSFYYSGRCCV